MKLVFFNNKLDDVNSFVKESICLLFVIIL